MTFQQEQIDFGKALKETWLPAPGLEATHEVSSLGRVRSIDRIYQTEYRNRTYSKKGQLLMFRKNKYGYPVFVVSAVRKQFKVHRLVAQAFILNPENKPTVNHKNGVRDDNRVHNLEWATLSEQQRHSIDVLGRKGAFLGKSGKDHNKSKSVLCIDNGVTYGSIREAERKLGIKNATICANLSGRLKHAGGLHFQYAKQ